MTTQSDPITGAQLNQIEQQAASIPGLAQPALSGKQFVFFAAFDGTNNDLHNVPNGETGTNVGELWRQYKTSSPGGPGNYYAGPGTAGSLTQSSWLDPQVTAEGVKTGQQAYKDFVAQAVAWYNSPEGGDPSAIAVAATSFSRGVDAAAVFAQLLYENGLRDALRAAVPPPCHGAHLQRRVLPDGDQHEANKGVSAGA